MFLVEPEPTPADVNFRLFGIPIRIHPFFWVMSLLLGQTFTLIPALIWIVAALISILVHELGHALVMVFYRQQPAIVLYAFGGMAIPRLAGRGSRWPTMRDLAITLAGPGTQLLLGVATVALMFLLLGDVGGEGWFWFLPDVRGLPAQRVMEFLFQLAVISIFWPILNLLPVYPLDGGQAVRTVLMKLNPYGGMRQSLILSVLVAVLLTVFAVVRMQSYFLAFLFGFLGVQNMLALQESR